MNSIVILAVLVQCSVNFANVKGYNCSLPLGNIKLEDCCAEPKMDRSPQADQCAAEYLSNDKLGGPNGGMACFSECLFNATGMLVNGEVDTRRAFVLIQEKLVKDPEYIPVMKKSFHKCLPIAKKKLARIPKESFKRNCNPYAKLIMDCVQRENFANCPSSKWVPTDECKNAKEYAQSCI